MCQFPTFINVMVSKGRAHERWWGRGSYERDSRGSLSLPPCEDSVRRRLPASQEENPHQTLNLPAPWTWTSQPLELWEINVCCVSHSVYQSMVFLLWQLEQTETKHYQGIYGTEKWLHLQFLREDVGSESNLQETLNFVGHKLREWGRRLAPLPSITRQHVRNASVGAIQICSWERSFQAIKTTSGVHESPNSIINEKGSARRVKESWPAFGSLRGET